VNVPYGGHFWHEGREFVAEGTVNTRVESQDILTGEVCQISTYATVGVWTEVYADLIEERERIEKYEAKVKAEGRVQMTKKLNKLL